MNLFEILKIKAREWRKSGYKCDYPAIAEIFDYNLVNSREDQKNLRYLRKAQFEALEIYWYLRLVEKTPRITDLYQRYFDGKKLFKSLGLGFLVENLGVKVLTEDFRNYAFNIHFHYDDGDKL